MKVRKPMAVLLMLSVVGWFGEQALGQTGGFTDGFENPTAMSNWQKWLPAANQVIWAGPNALFQSDNHPHSGEYGARQEQGQPGWWGSIHMEPRLSLSQDLAIHVTAWQFEDYNKKAPFTPAVAHDQVQGWVAVMDGDEQGNVTEFYALGVHAHASSPAPVSSWWQNLSWGTAVDGWHATNYPRSQGYRKLEIVVHPYTGRVGDVEFFVNGTLVGQGRRQAGMNQRGVVLTKLGLGANAVLMTEDYIANSYEFFWYDDVSVATCGNPEIRYDADGDGDVDVADFGYLQSCYPLNRQFDLLRCRCMDADGNLALDSADLEAFERCFSGPAVPADPSCDDGLPPP